MTTHAQVFDNSQRLIHEGPTTKWVAQDAEVVKVQIYLPKEKKFPASAFPLTVRRNGEPKPYIVTRGYYEDFEGSISFMGFFH